MDFSIDFRIYTAAVADKVEWRGGFGRPAPCRRMNWTDPIEEIRSAERDRLLVPQPVGHSVGDGRQYDQRSPGGLSGCEQVAAASHPLEHGCQEKVHGHDQQTLSHRDKQALVVVAAQDNRQPQQEQRDVEPGSQQTLVYDHPQIGPVIQTRVTERGDQLPCGRIPLPRVAISQLLESHVADDKTLVGFEPVGVDRTVDDGTATDGKSWEFV